MQGDETRRMLEHDCHIFASVLADDVGHSWLAHFRTHFSYHRVVESLERCGPSTRVIHYSWTISKGRRSLSVSEMKIERKERA